MLNERFGMLRVVAEAGTNRHRKKLWRCVCDCGGETVATTGNLRSGNSESCGCEKRDAMVRARITHGHTRGRLEGKPNSRAYVAWGNMINRCTNPNDAKFPRWGGRGITICERWAAFENFYADMGDPPEGHSLDRINNDGNYEPQNCRWADASTQTKNRRPMKSGRYITHNGRTLDTAEWSRELGLHRDAVLKRLQYGWDEVSAVTLPMHSRLGKS
jgi:hypothetical protein